MAKVQVNNGKSCFLWEDLWGTEPLIHKFPELLSFAKKKNISFAEGATIIPFHSLFHLLLSQQAHSQMLQLQAEVQEIQLNELSDKWIYIWNSNLFSVNKAYKHMSVHIDLHPVYKRLWNCSCQNKHKVFFLVAHKGQTKH